MKSSKPHYNRKRNPALRPHLKLWLASGERHVFCPGMCQILEAVERTGSIKAAARQVGKSYRHIWSRLKDAERALGRSLVETRVGGVGSGRSSLTPIARRIMTGFTCMRARLINAAEREWERCLATLDEIRPLAVRSEGA